MHSIVWTSVSESLGISMVYVCLAKDESSSCYNIGMATCSTHSNYNKISIKRLTGSGDSLESIAFPSSCSANNKYVLAR